MKFIIGLVFLVVFSILPATNSVQAQSFASQAAEGKKLHLKIIKNHPSLDSFYEEPYVFGSLTSNPLCLISVPSADWSTLSKKQKQQLFDYAASLIAVVKRNPDKYSSVGANAPAASRARRNISKMNSTSWGINVGDFTNGGRDILSDKTIKSLN